jgi:hypothetical protein
VENLEMSIVDVKYGQKTENPENEKHPLNDLKNDEITEKPEK